MKCWAVPATIVVAIEYIVALLIGWHVGFHYTIPFVTYAVVGSVVGFGGIAVAILWLVLRYVREREAHPIRRLSWLSSRFASFLVGTLLVTAEMGALMWLKVMLPLSVGFWADATLAAADHALFFTDPWRVAQFLFGWASALIDKAYVSWAPVKFSLLIFVLSRPEGEAKSRLLITYFLTVSTCTLAQYLLPSAGPIFYQQLGLGDRFAELPVHPWVETTREYLWQDYLRSGGKIGGGISAMPSVHVAVALWIALTVRSYFPRFEVIGFIYFFLILFGSVLLGWHYAVDGIAACLITSLAWILARVITRRSRARALNPALMVV